MLLLVVLFVATPAANMVYGQYRDPSAGKHKKRKHKEGKNGLFGFKRDGERLKKNKDPFTSKSKKKVGYQYSSTPPDKKKPRKIRIRKNKKTKPPKHKERKLKEKDPFSSKKKGKMYNSKYSKKKNKGASRKKKEKKKIFRKKS